MERKLNLIELNEINFDIIKLYVNTNSQQFPGFSMLFSLKEFRTFSEERYELIEPWIQWASVHTEKSYSEHKIFRLGDIVDFKGRQIFEVIESLGFKVGCVSPMNANNKLKNPSYFIPDPWTDTHADPSFISRNLHKALRQAVNDNAEGRVAKKTYIAILLGFLLHTQKKNWPVYIKLFLNRKKRWNKALFLDLLLSDIFISYSKKKSADFSTIFLNAFAHVQHHYILNSKFYDGEIVNPDSYISEGDDPFLDAMKVYDRIIFQLLSTLKGNNIFATGLRQVPVEKQVNYYRLKNHESFLKLLDLKDFIVEPRMTRDFKLTFNNKISEERAISILDDLYFNDEKLFDEIDIRDGSLFISLTYSKVITENCRLRINGSEINLFEEFVFVALKNGHHDAEGYVFTDLETKIFKNKSELLHVKSIGTEARLFFS